jgi:hypothetical protein
MTFFDFFISYLFMSLCRFVDDIAYLLTGEHTLQTTSISEYPRIQQTNFSPNRNYNIAVAAPPLTLLNVKTALSMMMPIEYLIRTQDPGISSCAKEEYFNEKSNHYSRFGKADPDSVARKQRACPTFYRI